MTTAIFILIAVLTVLVVIACTVLVAMEFQQAATASASAEQQMLETKLELRGLRRDVTQGRQKGAIRGTP